MGFKKGEPRPANAGRKKGTPNKRNTIFESLDEIVTEDGKPVDIVKMFFDGLMAMPPYQRVDALLEFMHFVYPKRKMIEVRDLSDEELKEVLLDRLAIEG